MTTLTEADIAAIREREKRASPGPCGYAMALGMMEGHAERESL